MQKSYQLNLIYFGVACFFLAGLISILYLTDLSLIFFVNQPFFSSSTEFLYQHVQQPFGVVNYLSLFVFQYYQNSILAILLVIIQVLTLYFLMMAFYRKYISVLANILFAALIILPLVIEQTSYFVMPVALMVYIVAMVFGLIFRNLATHGRLNYLHFTLFVLLVYWIAGLYGLTIFMSLVLPATTIKGQLRHSFGFISIAIACVFAMNLLVNYLFISDVSFFTGFYFNHPTFNQWILNFLPVLLLLIPLKKVSSWINALNAKAFFIASLVVFALWIFAFAKTSYKPVLKKCIAIDRMAANNQWNQILAIDDQALLAANQVKPIVYRALYHKGILLDKLFSYATDNDEENLIIHGPQDVSIAVPLMEFYFDLGLINESRHWANEALTATGYHQNVFIRLIESYLIIGEYATAEKYIGLLSTSPVNKKLAKEYQQMVQSPELIDKHPVLGRLKRIQPPPDFLVTYYNPYNNLYQLMQSSNPYPMVLEYYLAYELFRKNPQKVVESIKMFKQLNYPQLPVHCQEAILFYKAINGIKSTADMEGYVFDDMVTNRFNQFSSILFDTYHGNRSEAKAALAQFSDTFWYYYIYSGLKEIKKQNK